MVTFVFRGPTNIEEENIWKDTSQLDIAKSYYFPTTLFNVYDDPFHALHPIPQSLRKTLSMSRIVPCWSPRLIS